MVALSTIRFRVANSGDIMRNLSAFIRFCVCLLCVNTAFGKTYMVPLEANLQEVIDQSSAGDTLILPATTFIGNFIIDKSLVLDGKNQTVIDGSGRGNAIEVTASHVELKGLTIRNWGYDLTATDSGIKVKHTEHITVVDNRLQGDGFGIYLESVQTATVLRNQVQGNSEMRAADRGNGIHLTNVVDAAVVDNVVSQTRDGLYVINSQQNVLRNNRMSDLRFGIHYMYSYNNEISENASLNVKVGYALMSSNNLKVVNNRAENCEDYGLLLNFVNNSLFSGNTISNIRSSMQPAVSGDEGKALFVYNSTNNEIHANRFANSDMGIHLTAGSEQNKVYNNQFVDNEIQVKYVSSRLQEWSEQGVGNYWSNYVGWDLNNDGVGDSAFEPNDDIDKLFWKYPESKVLMDSPAVLLLRWVQRSFPVLKSPGVKDSFPLIRPQELPVDG